MQRPLAAALARHGALIVAAVVVLFPFLWIAVAACKTQ
ncbi:MAG: carbohydrate ABC transporter permease, partial [Planctomycetes bacterium]|nr:carbohydrate ABC transporter permease [Planctomycetota bacterium]